jgi:hypothetical protein
MKTGLSHSCLLPIKISFKNDGIKDTFMQKILSCKRELVASDLYHKN